MADNKVLLVDDEEDFTTTLAERMRLRGLEVVVASSGSEAIEILKNQDFDAIFLDMVMPGMDGLETLQHVQNLDPDHQVVLLTGQGDLKKGIESIKLGAMDYLEKPADLNKLLEKISEAKSKRMVLVDKKLENKINNILKTKGW